MFGKKKTKKCEHCDLETKKDFSYCPNCGNPMKNKDKEMKDYGLIGTSDYEEMSEENPFSFGITDKLINTMVNSLMKNLDKQFKEMDRNYSQPEIKSFPNGIRIKIGYPGEMKQQKPRKSQMKKELTNSQIKKMSSLPRAQAKSSIKRLNDSIIYELATPGVDSPQDIFISKLEDGYEIKAIGAKKVYINTLPINLPMKKLSLIDQKLLVEFTTED